MKLWFSYIILRKWHVARLLAGEKESSPPLLVGEQGYSSANMEVQKVEAQHHRKRGACYVCI